MRNTNLTTDQQEDAIDRAAECGDVCGQCFRLLAPTDNVTLDKAITRTGRFVRVPVCRACIPRRRKGVTVTTCRGCGRTLRYSTYGWSTRYAQTCSLACTYVAKLARNAERRRVDHDDQTCVHCTNTFTPRRADALTCSPACRQASYRRRQHDATA